MVSLTFEQGFKLELDDLSKSGIRRLADFSPHLDQLAGLATDMGLRQRSNLVHLERCLHQHWSLGQNTILSWAPLDEGVLILVVPHYAVAEYTTRTSSETQSKISPKFITDLISGERQLSFAQMQKVARLLAIEPAYIPLRQPLTGHPVETEIIEKMIRRYGINYIASRAVTMFDIVGFGLLTPFEQMTQLNSLSYSLNSAHSRMLDLDIEVNFARSTTGDGFYVWNRDDGIEANVNLYHYMHIVLADNAMARAKSTSNAVPKLRAGFHVGSCYEFHQAEGLNPTMTDYIVGDVTIELARMVDAAVPEQILVGDFLADFSDERVRLAASVNSMDAVNFLDRAQGSLSKLNQMELAGERVTAIKCYLTGEQIGESQFDIRKLKITDKHGLMRYAYNAKMNIYRENSPPILLGIQDKSLPTAAKTMSEKKPVSQLSA